MLCRDGSRQAATLAIALVAALLASGLGGGGPPRSSGMHTGPREAAVDGVDVSHSAVARPATAYIMSREGAWPATPPPTFDPDLGALIASGLSDLGYYVPYTSSDVWELNSSGWEPFPWGPSSGVTPYGSSQVVYDTSSHALLLFVGASPCPTRCRDAETVWKFQAGGWTLLANGSRSPPALMDPSMVYDPAFQGVLVFGGWLAWNDSRAPPSRDLWLLSGGNWTNLDGQFPYRPGDRAGASFVYDTATNTGYLFGGVGPSVPNGTGNPPSSETWAFSSAGWSNLSAVLPIPLPLVNGGAVAFDTELGAVVAVGPGGPSFGIASTSFGNGSHEEAPFGSTISWEMTGSTWTNITSASQPAPFTGSAVLLADDPALGGLVLSGGRYGIFSGAFEPCPPDSTYIPPTMGSTDVRIPELSYTWLFRGGDWSTIASGESAEMGGDPPLFPTWGSYNCRYPAGPAEAMVIAGTAMLVGVGTALPIMFRRSGLEAPSPAHRSRQRG